VYLLCDYLVVSAPAIEPLAGLWRDRYLRLLNNPTAQAGRLWGYDTVSVDGGATILGVRRSEAGEGFERSLLAVAGGAQRVNYMGCWLV
jgi:hypothetical protein